MHHYEFIYINLFWLSFLFSLETCSKLSSFIDIPCGVMLAHMNEQLAMLAKQCVEEDPMLRPDMKQIVITLSQILLSSVEWEATLAGNSQIFSGLVQGR